MSATQDRARSQRAIQTAAKPMSIQEFNATEWRFFMTAEYHGKEYKVGSADFDEKLVGLLGVIQNEPDEILMVRCENVTLISRHELSRVE